MKTGHRISLVGAATVIALAASSLAWAAPMNPSQTPWDPFTEVEQSGGLVDGPGRVAQFFIDDNLFFGSNLDAIEYPTPPGGGGGFPGGGGGFPGGGGGFPGGGGSPGGSITLPDCLPPGFVIPPELAQIPGFTIPPPCTAPSASVRGAVPPTGTPPGGMPPDGMPSGGGSSGYQRCESIDSAPCDTADAVTLNVVLPACTPQRTKDCIESLYVVKDGVVEEATFAEQWIGKDSYDFPAVQTTDGPTPASGYLPIFRLPSTPHSAGDLYAASVVLDFIIERKGTTWEPQIADLGGQIIPVKKIPYDNALQACKDVGTTAPSYNECLQTWYTLPDEIMGIRANVSPAFGSWIFGRVIEPQITVTSQGDSITLDVKGRPAVTPNLTAVVPSAEATFDMYRGTPPAEGPLMTTFKAGERDSLSRWAAWNSPSGSRADTLKRLWVFRSSDAQFTGMTKCIKAGEVAGWISTNAMVYEASPPVFNKTTGALDFKIGGPAVQPDGTSLVSADYELFLRTGVAACIWPGQKVAQVATVSVIDGAGGEEVTSTSVGESGGWTRFIARNVLFPKPVGVRTRAAGAANPTVRVVVPQAAPATFANCTLMRKTYKDGVTATGAVNTVTVKGKKVTRPALGSPFVSDAIYTANAKLDTDKDRLVCEREPKVR